MKRILYAAAALLALTLAAGATPRTGPKLTTVYRSQANGEWQLYVFGAEPCARGYILQTLTPIDATAPLIVRCDLGGGR